MHASLAPKKSTPYVRPMLAPRKPLSSIFKALTPSNIKKVFFSLLALFGVALSIYSQGIIRVLSLAAATIVTGAAAYFGRRAIMYIDELERNQKKLKEAQREIKQAQTEIKETQKEMKETLEKLEHNQMDNDEDLVKLKIDFAKLTHDLELDWLPTQSDEEESSEASPVIAAPPPLAMAGGPIRVLTKDANVQPGTDLQKGNETIVQDGEQRSTFTPL